MKWARFLMFVLLSNLIFFQKTIYSEQSLQQFFSLVKNPQFLKGIQETRPDNAENNRYVKKTFHDEYMKKYYPKALVIIELFLSMKPAEIAQALQVIVDVFTDTPWFYFNDLPHGFKLVHYWEYVIDQSALVNTFLKKARIDRKTGVVFLPERRGFSYTYPTDSLLLVLKKNHKEVIARFYALSFDYLVKLFNEGILLKDLNKASKYYSELNFVLTKLHDTRFENEYREALTTCNELLNLLKQKCGMDLTHNNDESFFGNFDDYDKPGKIGLL